MRPADPPCGSVAQRAAALVFAATLVSAARGGRLEGGREGEVGGQLHRARVLRAAVAPLVESEAGLRGGLDGLRAALVEGATALRTGGGRSPRGFPRATRPRRPLKELRHTIGTTSRRLTLSLIGC